MNDEYIKNHSFHFISDEKVKNYQMMTRKETSRKNRNLSPVQSKTPEITYDATEFDKSVYYSAENLTQSTTSDGHIPQKHENHEVVHRSLQSRLPPQMRKFEQPTNTIQLTDFKVMIEGWVETWPAETAAKAPDPDVSLLYPVCNQYPVSWLQRALKLITRDLYQLGKARSPGSILYSAAYNGWLKYFPEEAPLSCELCGGVLASAEYSRCPRCAEQTRKTVKQKLDRESTVREEVTENAGKRQLQEIWELNSLFMEKYGITVPRIAMIVKQHPRHDLINADLEHAAYVISKDPHLRYTPGAPVCSECKTGKQGRHPLIAQKEQANHVDTHHVEIVSGVLQASTESMPEDHPDEQSVPAREYTSEDLYESAYYQDQDRESPEDASIDLPYWVSEAANVWTTPSW